MKDEFVLNLNKKWERPVVREKELNVLIDTGALIPMTTLSENILVELYNAKKVLDNVTISGIGGNDGECKGKVYVLELFKLGTLSYPNLHIFVPDNRHVIEFDFLVSATMLNNLIIQFDFKNGNMLVRVPDDEQLVKNLVLKDRNGKITVLYN